MGHERFKRCPGCHIWLSADEIVNDPSIKPLGMAFMGTSPDQFFYLFQHIDELCGSSFLVEVTKFRQFLDEAIPDDSLFETDNCEGHCVDLHDLAECRQKCRNAPFRRFLLEMINRKRNTSFYESSRAETVPCSQD